MGQSVWNQVALILLVREASNMNDIKIPFNRPCWVGNELANMGDSIRSGHVAGNGPYTKKAQSLLSENLSPTSKVLLTTSCTDALEMAAILLDLQPGDEVIVPSFNFVSLAFAFLMNQTTQFC